MKNNDTVKLDLASVGTRLALCAAALAGTAGAVTPVEAAVITNTIPIPVPQTTAGVYINFLTGATGTSAFTGWDFNPYNTASGLGFYWNQTALGGLINAGVATGVATNLYANLTLGSTVSSTSPFTSAIQGTSANYRGTGIEILGFRFVNEATNAFNYGYLTIQTTATTGFPATILSYSYENSGGAITVVPEPSTTALLSISLLVVGAVGLREWRRRQVA